MCFFFAWISLQDLRATFTGTLWTRLKTDAVRRISNHNGSTRAPIDGAPRPSAIVPTNRDFRVGLPNISCVPTPSSGIPSEGEKRDSKGDMLGYSFHTANQDEKSTQQRLLCSGASVSDSAEGDLLGPVSRESPAHWVLNALIVGMQRHPGLWAGRVSYGTVMLHVVLFSTPYAVDLSSVLFTKKRQGEPTEESLRQRWG